MNEEQKKPASVWRTLLMVLLVLGIILALYFGLAWILRTLDKNSTTPASSSTSSNLSGKIDSALVGSWQSECLVPDQGSKWAEQHFFTIKSDATAAHIRKSYFAPDCTTLQPELTITETYKVAIPSTDKINLTWKSYDNAQIAAAGMSASSFVGKTLYDIYEANASTLKFGHGFRDDLPYDGPSGMSEAERFTSLNDYIVYTKR